MKQSSEPTCPGLKALACARFMALGAAVAKQYFGRRRVLPTLDPSGMDFHTA